MHKQLSTQYKTIKHTSKKKEKKNTHTHEKNKQKRSERTNEEGSQLVSYF